ncbi:MAG: hypothetical protein ACJ73S_11225 [Mycobacteriales bacterium]
MRDYQRPQSPWARGAQAVERQPATAVEYPPIQDLPLPEYPPGNLKYQYYDESSWEYAERGYEPEYAEYPRPEYPEYPEYLPEPERPRRDRRRMLVVVAAVAAAVGGGALVAVVFGGSSQPRGAHQVADSRRTTGDPTVGDTGPDAPSANPTIDASPPASPTSAAARAVKPAAPRAARPAGPAPLRYTGTTGPGCATSGTATFRVYGGGWNATGGNAGSDGCGGQAVYADTGDSSGGGVPDGVVWSWNPGWNRPATCTVSVFVPNSDKATATRVSYQVLAGDQMAGSFRVNQAASRGRWVTSPPYQTSGAITVLVDNRGPTGYSLAAGAARASCTG